MSSHSRDTTVEICGVEHDVVVEFEIHSFGSPSSRDDPGDPAELSITAVYYKDEEDLPSPRDISQVLSELRDLSLQKTSRWARTPSGDIRHFQDFAYGRGFDVLLGHRSGNPLEPSTWRYSSPRVTLNSGSSLLDSLETELHENVSDYEDHDCDWGD